MPKRGLHFKVWSTNEDHVPEYNRYNVCCCLECRMLLKEEIEDLQFVETRKATKEELENAAKYYPGGKQK